MKAFKALLGHLSVSGGQEFRHRFQDGDFEPRRRHTPPISRPITPAPITPSVFGTAPMFSAPSLDSTTFVERQAGQFARRTGRHDHVLGDQVFLGGAGDLDRPAAFDLAGERALPWKKVTLFFLNRYRMPSLFCLTTEFLRPISVSSFRLTPLTSMPCSAKWWLACS